MEECETSFQKFKETLSAPPMLIKSNPRETLYLYLAIAEEEISVALVKDYNKVQKLIYFISRALENAELRYPKVENGILALVFSSRRLPPYFQVHPIIV